MLKTSGHGSIRKVKGGAVGVLALSTLLVGVGTVSANEASATEQPSVELKAEKEPAEVSDNKKLGSEKQESKQDAPKQEESKKDSSTEKEVPKDTDKETYKKAESKEFDFAKENAKENGVSVKEDTKPSIKDNEKDAQEDLAKQVKVLKDATKTQIGSDAITSLDKEKLTEAGIRVKEGKVKLFTDLKEMEAFVKKQSKEIATDIEGKHIIDDEVQFASKELKEAGIEVVVGEEVVKSSPQEAVEALKALQTQVISAVKAKQELDSAYLALQERAKSAGLLTKEGKGITFDSAKDAKDFLNKQVEEVNTLISSLKQENDKLIGAIATAESYGIKVSKASNLKAASIKDATDTVATQVTKFNNLVKSIEESKALISTVVENAKKAGVALEGETVVNSAKGEEDKLKEKVTSALKELQDATAAQTSAKEQLAKLVEDAKAKGITVTISGNKKVSVEGVSAELSAIKEKIAKAVADKEKAESDYATALKNAKEASRLLEGSTATKEGDVYKQSLTIKSNGTKGSISLKATGSAEILSVELVDPTGKKVDSVKTLADLTSYTDFSKQGDYVVNYTFRAKDDTSGSVVSSANTQGVAAVEGKATGTLSVTTKAKVTESTSTSKKHEPMDLIQIIDLSGSLSDGEYKQRNGVSGARRQQINDMIYVIEHQLTDEDHVMLAFYGTNKGNSYVVGGQDGGIATKLMTKKEAIALLNKINAEKQVHEVAQSWTLIPNVIKPLLENYVASDAQDGTGFEDVYKAQSNRNKVVSVLQFTDNWTLNEKEDIDTTFAEWAKATAKTFMTVVDDPDPDSSLSVSQMKKAGHPNIKTFRSLNDSNRQEEIAKLFQSTATVTTKTTTKGEDQLVTVSITGTNTAKVTKATLKGATNKDLPIKDGKVDFSEKLPDGTWAVDYELSGDGDVTVTATVAGKEVVKETKSLKEVKGAEGTSATKTDNLNAVVLPTAPEVRPITVEDLTVLAKNVLLGTIESDSTTVTVEKELNKPNFKETVSPITFEREVVPTQAEVTTHDVYVKTPRPAQPEGKVLPKTGESDSGLVQAAGLGLGVLGVLGLAGKRKED